ncbi:Ig-like domain-containing protein [Micromonospora sp. NPDC050397]|uniref:Ig-like domain-containing protein n=1 Tax=Micromonospora sp. NPDC050397 TaxID=3364279 RepID=UPI00384C5E19
MDRLTRLVGRTGVSLVAAGLFAVTAMTAAVLIGLAPPVQAAPLGSLTLDPTNGTLDANPALVSASTSAACPADKADQAVLQIGQVGGELHNLSRIASEEEGYGGAPFALGANRSILSAFNATSLPGGDYRVVIVCISGESGPHPDPFETLITVDGNTWQVKGGGGPINTPTTTALTVTPTGSARVDEQVTMTAQVSPPEAAGTVQFQQGEGTGARSIGDPVTVVDGRASVTLPGSDLGDGVHELSALFVPTGTGYGPSTSTLVTYEITDESTRTTISLAVQPGSSAEVGAEVTLTATVTPADAVGKVKFTYRGAQTIGSPVDVTSGTASIRTSQLPAGDYQLAARFEPTDPNLFEASDSEMVPYRIGAAPTPTPTGSPTPTPTTSATPSESPDPTTTESPTPTPTSSESGGGGGNLALTGTSIPTLVTGGAVLLGGGVGMLLLTRRRRTGQS